MKSKNVVAKAANPIFDGAIEAAVLGALTPIAPRKKAAAAMKQKILKNIAATQSTVVTQPLRASSGTWQTVASGIEQQMLFSGDATMARLIRFAPGAIVPGHQHRADEAAWVMEGWCTVGGYRLNTGDYQMVPAGASHGDIVSPDGCILFIHTTWPAARASASTAR